MALRILSGIVKTAGIKKGEVIIQLSDHRLLVHTAGTGLIETSTIGPARAFPVKPAKHVALRQLLLDPITGFIGPGPLNRFILNDDCTTEELKISWDGEGASFIEEISYLVIGDV